MKHSGLILDGLKNGSLPAIYHQLQNALADIYELYPQANQYELFSMLSQMLPAKIPDESFQSALKAVNDTDKETQTTGRQTILFLSARTISAAIDRVGAGLSPEDKSELAEQIIVVILSQAHRFTSGRPVNPQIAAKLNHLVKGYEERLRRSVSVSPNLAMTPNDIRFEESTIDGIVVHDALIRLSKHHDRQWKVILPLYGFSDTLTAEELALAYGVSRTAIDKSKKEGLEYLRKQLHENPHEPSMANVYRLPRKMLAESAGFSDLWRLKKTKGMTIEEEKAFWQIGFFNIADLLVFPRDEIEQSLSGSGITTLRLAELLKGFDDEIMIDLDKPQPADESLRVLKQITDAIITYVPLITKDPFRVINMLDNDGWNNWNDWMFQMAIAEFSGLLSNPEAVRLLGLDDKMIKIYRDIIPRSRKERFEYLARKKILSKALLPFYEDPPTIGEPVYY